MSTNKWTYDKFKYDPWTYASYKEGDSVKEALKKRTDAENAMANYGDFIFSKQGEYDSLYDQYKNRGDFTYDLNGDALYQQYKDKYIQQGKLAMADTMGQAAAMTGGYGNSYAQSVGQQAYQASLDNLNDIVPELYAMALDRYNQKGQEMLNMIGLLGDERNFEYGVWGDGYNRLATDRDYYGSQYADERTFDYGKYVADRELDYSQYSSDRSLAYDEYATDKNLSYDEYRNAIADAQWREEMDFQKEKYEDSKAKTTTTTNPTNNNKQPEKEPETVKPTETANTTSFINSHITSSEFMQRGGTSKTPSLQGGGGRSYAEYKTYIKAELEKYWDSWSDEEKAYLIEYYKL